MRMICDSIKTPIIVGSYGKTYNTMGLCFDGYSVWSCGSSGWLIRIRVSDGVVEKTYNLGANNNLYAICFDGNDFWAIVYKPSEYYTGIAKISQEGNIVVSYAIDHTASPPTGICFAGSYIWFARGTTLYKMTTSGVFTTYGTSLHSSYPTDICFLSGNNSVYIAHAGKLILDRKNIYGYNSYDIDLNLTSYNPSISTDGEYLYIAQGASSPSYNLLKVHISTLSVVESYSLYNSAAFACCFDGAHLWVAISDYLLKILI